MSPFLSNAGEKVFTNLIKELADEKIFPTALYYNIEEEIAVIEISAAEEDMFNQIFKLTPNEIFHKVEQVCLSNGADKEEKHFTTKYFVGSEIEIIINK